MLVRRAMAGLVVRGGDDPTMVRGGDGGGDHRGGGMIP